MELEVKNIIFGTLREVLLVQQPEKWIAISTEIFENLDRLNPTVCEDGDIGKIAFGSDDKRMKIRTARFLTRKLHLNSGFLNDVQIRSIQTHIDEILFDDMIQTYISTGDDIGKNYRDHIGGASCMTGGSAYVGLYVDNPDTYSQLIMKRGNDSARAMIVRLDNGLYMLDRIYTDAEDLIEKMKNYADDQGWLISWNRAIPHNLKIQIIVTGLSYTDGEVPYQDTLQYGRIRDRRLDLMFDDCHDYDFLMDNTNGNIGSGYICYRCEEPLPEDEYWSYGDEIYCQYCFDRVAFICSRCGEATPNEDDRQIVVEGVTVCSSCAENHYSFCNECNEYFSTEHVQQVKSENRDVCDECLDQHYQECTDCREFFSELIELDAGDKVCKDCWERELDDEKKEVGGALMQIPMQNIICEGQREIPFEDWMVG